MRWRLHSSRYYVPNPKATPLRRLHLIRFTAFSTFSSRRRLPGGISHDYESLLPNGRRCRANSETDEGECSIFTLLDFPRNRPPHQAHFIRQLLPKEKPSVKRADRLYPAPNYRSRGSRQRSWMPGLAKPDQGGKQEANGGKLAFIRAVQAFTCPVSEQPFNLI